VRRLNATAIAIPGGGIGAGAAGALGAATGDPLWGAAAADVMARTLNDMVTRTLSAREMSRVATVGNATASALARLMANGTQLRDDDFFTDRIDGRASGDEVVEHVFLAARGWFEERKLPLHGQLLASIACYENISSTTANWAITTFDSLSYAKVLLLAANYRRDEFTLNSSDLYSNPLLVLKPLACTQTPWNSRPGAFTKHYTNSAANMSVWSTLLWSTANAANQFSQPPITRRS
jgi:hypothetical protein